MGVSNLMLLNFNHPARSWAAHEAVVEVFLFAIFLICIGLIAWRLLKFLAAVILATKA